jgi:hypothetical protein
LKQFLDAGGQLVAIGSSTNVAYHLNLPVRDAMVELAGDGKERKLPEEKYYVPGSVLRVNYDRSKPANWGMEESGDIYFDNSPVFKITTEAVSSGRVKPLAWFGTAKPLRSGWAWGQAYLQVNWLLLDQKLPLGHKLMAHLNCCLTNYIVKSNGIKQGGIF